MQALSESSYSFNPSLVLSQAAKSDTSLFQKVSTVFWTVVNALRTVLHLITLPIYTLLDDGLANLLGLQSLRHGTCLTNYVSILTHGGDPSHGGKESGSSAGGQPLMGKEMAERYIQESQGHFHVFADNDFKGAKGCMPLFTHAVVCFLPLMHTTFSGMGTFVSPESKGCVATAGRVAGAVLNFFTPTIRFKFTEGEMGGRFECDPDYGPAALRTRHKIEPWRTGIVGTLAVGLNLGVFKRILEHPIKFLLGVIEIVAAAALALVAATALMLV